MRPDPQGSPCRCIPREESFYLCTLSTERNSRAYQLFSLYLAVCSGRTKFHQVWNDFLSNEFRNRGPARRIRPARCTRNGGLALLVISLGWLGRGIKEPSTEASLEWERQQ